MTITRLYNANILSRQRVIQEVLTPFLYEVNSLAISASYSNKKNSIARLEQYNIRLSYDTKSESRYNQHGFRGQIYIGDNGSTYAAIRGLSAESLKIMQINFFDSGCAMGILGQFDRPYRNCIFAFAKQLLKATSKDADLFLLGHSLGGGAANYLAILLAMLTADNKQIIGLASDPIGAAEDNRQLLKCYKQLQAEGHRSITLDLIQSYLESDNKNKDFEQLMNSRSALLWNRLRGPDSEKLLRHKDKLTDWNRHNHYRNHLHNEFGHKLRLLNLIFATEHENLMGNSYLQLSPPTGLTPIFGETLLLAVKNKELTDKLFNAPKALEAQKDSSKTAPLLTRFKKAVSSFYSRGVGVAISAMTSLIPSFPYGLLVVHTPKLMQNFEYGIMLRNTDSFITSGAQQLLNPMVNQHETNKVLEHSVDMSESKCSPLPPQIHGKYTELVTRQRDNAQQSMR